MPQVHHIIALDVKENTGCSLSHPDSRHTSHVHLAVSSSYVNLNQPLNELSAMFLEQALKKTIS